MFEELVRDVGLALADGSFAILTGLFWLCCMVLFAYWMSAFLSIVFNILASAYGKFFKQRSATFIGALIGVCCTLAGFIFGLNFIVK
ncbi:MAG TPA: hypothetical protein V6C81_09750 [Planktothrix sp.]|jgi:hypothetical protein